MKTNRTKQKFGARDVNNKETFPRTALTPDLALFSVMTLAPKNVGIL